MFLVFNKQKIISYLVAFSTVAILFCGAGFFMPNLEETIIVYCSTGHRSQRAQQILENMGYKNVYNVYEGVTI